MMLVLLLLLLLQVTQPPDVSGIVVIRSGSRQQNRALMLSSCKAAIWQGCRMISDACLSNSSPLWQACYVVTTKASQLPVVMAF
jgi:hypothetical protein